MSLKSKQVLAAAAASAGQYLLEGADRCQPRQPRMNCSAVAAIDQSQRLPIATLSGLTGRREGRRKQPSLVADAQKKADKMSIPLN